jgi:hypothetical protein
MTPDEFDAILTDLRRSKQHTDMLLASALSAIVAHIEIGNVTQALETLKTMRDHYRKQADQ